MKPHLGVCHGDDLFYLFPFGVFGFPKTLKTASDKNISKWMLTWISNFAAKSDPGSVNNVQWLPIQPSSSYQVLRIDKNNVTFGPYEETIRRKIEFWNEYIQPNENGSNFTEKPVTQIYKLIAEKRFR